MLTPRPPGFNCFGVGKGCGTGQLLRGRRVLGLKRPSSRGGAEAEDPVGREPWTGPAVAMGTAGRRRRAEAGRPAGQFRGAPASDREWPRAGTWGRAVLAGWARELPSQAGETQVPCSRPSLLRPELYPPRSRTYLQFICVNYLLSGGLPSGRPACLRPPCPPRLFTSWFAAAPGS